MELNPFSKKDYGVIDYGAYKPFDDRDWIRYNCSYKNIVDSIAPNKVEWFIESGYNNYQGDMFFLGKSKLNDGSIYYVTTGYGSCSGCDMLEACSDESDFDELRDYIAKRVRVFDSVLEFRDWFNDIGQTEYYERNDAGEFCDKVNSSGLGIEIKYREHYYKEDDDEYYESE